MVQYIGARYVPAFYGAWTANTDYDPLTIVTYNGNSYTSKVKVPAAVGAPDLNAQYWAVTGSYNAQINDLQNKFSNFTPQESDTRLTGYVDTADQYFSNVGTAELDGTDLLWPEVDANNLACMNDVRSPMRAYFNPGNSFRFAYRMPANNSFSVNDFINMLQEEKDIYQTYSWMYYTETPEYPNGMNQIPLYNPDDPTQVLNPNGKGSSCATAICNVMYKLGWTDLAGDARYTEARIDNVSFPYYLQQKGWQRIDNFDDIQRGDICFTGQATYGDERARNPRHEFVYAGNSLVYDFGSTALIQDGGTSSLSGSLAAADLYNKTIWENSGLVTLGSASTPNTAGTDKWVGEILTGVDNGNPFKVQRMVNANNRKRWQYIATTDGSTISNSYEPYPLTLNNTVHDLAVKVKLFEDGTIRVKLNGTPDATLAAGTGYTLFSFNSYTNPNYKALAEDYESVHLMTKTGIGGRFYTQTAGGITVLKFTPLQNTGDDICVEFTMSLF